MPFETVIDRKTVAEHLEDADWLLFDCRFDLSDPQAGRLAYLAGHLPGAVYVHLDEDLAGPTGPDTGRHPLPEPGHFADRLRQWGVSEEKQLVAYDDGPGHMAVRFWWLCRHLGLEAVAVMSGGYRGWEADRRPVSREKARRAPGEIAAMCREDDTVSAGTLERALAHRRMLLLDARSAERFRGEREPIDARAGHVPGARNRPFSENLDAQGEFKSQESLRREFQRLLGERDPAEVAHMCGSGVTACHNLLAMEHAGLTGSKLYAGSWSHWITDPDRPVATGDK